MMSAYLEATNPTRRFVESVELDRLDLTGLSSAEASTLGVLLQGWNPGVKRVFVWRHGRRYLSPAVRRLDLSHPFIAGQAFAADLETLIRECFIPVECERFLSFTEQRVLSERALKAWATRRQRSNTA